ncbi:hypothetical protein [Amycolatopsis alba]|uniref:Lipoprotein n=1 Tax=Amycolatopsis alba DSM 44262 TaxID=1125972 RepID=A0A229RDX5_AMYAL|nr:hypothetical protein [Amycolatopsis alba]OXM44866.1 hypothetical protein CFP75_33130 [Amycolatopsis alba DSM 44262]
MSQRVLPALFVSLTVLVGACSGGGGDNATSEAPATSEPGPKYTRFADFPGKALSTVEPGAPVGIQVKPVDVVWTPELAGKSAKPGEHYLAVYLAVTGELPDRGVKGARLDFLEAKVKIGPGTCNEDKNESPELCYLKASPATGLEKEVADSTWRSRTWLAGSITRTDIEAGDTVIGVVGFHIADDATIEGDMELCGPAKGEFYDDRKFPCVTIPKPEGTRN